MPKLFVTKRIDINASVDTLKDFLTDFHNWQHWSPWLLAEPEADVQVQEDGKYFKWIGNRTGEGEMKVYHVSGQKIDYDLNFIKPFKSKAKVFFNFKPKGDITEVEWVMNSSLPFFLFFLKKQTEAAIGMDYDRGLKMLKEHVETGKVDSHIEILEQQKLPGCNYIGIKRSSSFASIGPDMEQDFTSAKEYFETNNIETTSAPFSIYPKMDIVSGRMDYIAGFPVESHPADLPSNMFAGSLPDMMVQKVRHTGKYEHLGNGWFTIMSMMRNKEFKANKSLSPMEIYLSDPKDTDPNAMVVDICHPIK